MSPSHTRKQGVRYRYYTSLAPLQGRADGAGSLQRVPAAEVEAVVADAVRARLKLTPEVNPAELIATHVARVEVRQRHLIVSLRTSDELHDDEASNSDSLSRVDQATIERRREILLPTLPVEAANARPIRADARARLVAAIAQGRRWLSELSASADANSEQIAARERCSIRKVNMTISLAFLAPDLVKATIEGRLPRGIGMKRLSDLPVEWALQRQALGLAAR